MDSSRPSLFLGLIAAVVGLIAGVCYAWFIQPVEFTFVTPAELLPEYRSTWITLVAASYAVENDWGRANFRLNSLGEENISQSVADVTRRAIAELQPAPILRALARLSDRLGIRSPEMIVYLATPLPTSTPDLRPPSPIPTQPTLPPPTFTPTFVPPDTPTPLPTLTLTPTPLPSYLLVEQDRQCQTGLETSQIHVNVEDGEGQGIPGIEVWINWGDGADRLVTGLKPELGTGYGDFDMRPGATYNVSVGTSAVPLVSDLKVEVCPSDVPTQTAYAVWWLVFRTVPPTPTPTPTITPTVQTEQTAVIVP